MGRERYSRSEALFGAEGQATIAGTRVAIVGLGGLGSHVAQQLAYLGVCDYALIDFDVVTDSSLNRLVGALDADVAGATRKIGVAKRMIRGIKPEANVKTVNARLNESDVEPVISKADVVFACLDRDLPRLQLTALCSRYAQPLFDLATDISGDGEELRYGGRVLFCDGSRCLSCLGLLDQEEMRLDGMSPDERAAHDRIYGIKRSELGDTGPMVVSVNGAVASLAVTEFMVLVTGMRDPAPHLSYYAEKQIIRRNMDQPAPDCYYCTGVTGLWGTGLSSEPV